MNWAAFFLMVLFAVFILSFMIYRIRVLESYIRADWVDVRLLPVLYAVSFVMLSLVVSVAWTATVLLLGFLVLLIQVVWVICFAEFQWFGYAVVLSTLSFIVCAVLGLVIDREVAIGILPFLFFLIVEVAASMNVYTNNPGRDSSTRSDTRSVNGRLPSDE
jgi:hypothetical protein